MSLQMFKYLLIMGKKKTSRRYRNAFGRSLTTPLPCGYGCFNFMIRSVDDFGELWNFIEISVLAVSVDFAFDYVKEYIKLSCPLSCQGVEPALLGSNMIHIPELI